MDIFAITGLDPSGYRQAMMREHNGEDEALLGAALSDEEKYRDCDRFKYKCTNCGKEIIMDNAFTGAVSGCTFSYFLGYLTLYMLSFSRENKHIFI